MNALTFIHKYFSGWSIATMSTYGNIRCIIKLRSGETFVNVHINLNGSKHWTDYCATVDYITAAE